MSFARHRDSLFIKLAQIRQTPLLRVTFIIVCGTLLIIFFMIFSTWYRYYNSEKEFARDKLFYYYWIGKQSLEHNSFALRKLHSAYGDDIITAEMPYGVRVVNTLNNQTLMYLYPRAWTDINNNQLLFPPIEQSTEKYRKGIAIPMNSNNKQIRSHIVAYSLALNNTYIIQVLISTEERHTALKTMKNIVWRNLFMILLLVCVISYTVFKIVLNPIYHINTLAQQIIQQQAITERLPERKNSQLMGLDKSINEMLNTIERLVNSLRQANVNLSHDIRTPLTHIRNRLEMIYDESKNKQVHSHLEICLHSLDSLQKFTTQILDRAEIESGIVQIPEKPENILIILEDVIEMYEYIADSKDIIFKYDIEPELYVYVHKLRFCQLVGNLLDNACKFTSAGKQIVLSAQNIDNTIQIQVADEGQGIAEEDIPHIWDMFWKKGATDKNAKNNSGFGLSIVKSIVVAYGGTIDVNSHKGQGTVFTIKFSSPHSERYLPL